MNAARIRALKDEVCEQMAAGQVKRYNSWASSGAERMVQTAHEQVGALARATETRLKTRSGEDSPLLTWLPRHAAWLWRRRRIAQLEPPLEEAETLNGKDEQDKFRHQPRYSENISKNPTS